MRLKFIMSEVVAGLRRNLTMTIAMILTTAISLGLLGTGLLIKREIDSMKDIYYDKVQVSIFLTDDVTSDQKTAIEQKLDDLKDKKKQVKSVTFESRDEAYERFKKQFESQPDLVKNTPKEAIPESYRVSLVDPEDYKEIAKAFTVSDTGGVPTFDPGVDSVRDEGQILDRLFSVLNGLRSAVIAIAIAGAIAALLLISNTVQLAAFTRRTETGIMRLVGASRWYTQVPFVIEAAVAGLIGAGMAIGGLFLLKRLLFEGAFASIVERGTIPPVYASDIWAVSPLIAGAGVVLAGLTAWLTLRLYVRS